MTPKELANKIIAGILKKPGVTYQRLEEHALKLNIPLGIFENAMNLVHKDKTIQSKLQRGVIIYVPRKEKTTGPLPHVTWCSENYPWPGKNGVPEFVMPFPEWDLSFIFMKPDEAEAYHATIKNRKLFKKKKYEYKK